MDFISLDSKKIIVKTHSQESYLRFASSHWISLAKKSIEKEGFFFVALSGGNTPKAIFQELVNVYKNDLSWDKVKIFWGDERAVQPSSDESNYKQAMDILSILPLKKENIFRMRAEENIMRNAFLYEETIKSVVPSCKFDLIMLGMGEDGHIASLFPNTKALKETKRLVVENYIPDKKIFRMTFTYPLLDLAKNIMILVSGESKQKALIKALGSSKELLPASLIGKKGNSIFWILDPSLIFNL